MATEKKALFVVFKMNKNIPTAEWRKIFSAGYQTMFNLPGLFFKSWWCNQEKHEWGALYIFDSGDDLQRFITSDLFLNKIPARYGVKPEFNILEPGPIICKKIITEAENSWMTE